MASKPSKAKADTAMPVFKPSMHLEGQQAKAMQGHPVGAKVRVVVEGTVRGHSLEATFGEKKATHHTRIEIDRVKPQRYEGSPADKKADRAGAKKAGVTQKQWERSAADKREDRKGADRKGKR